MRRLPATGLLTALCLLVACERPNSPALTDATGQPLETNGHWLLINYWASWCKPCRQEIPELNQLHHELELPDVMGIPVTFLVNPQGQYSDHLSGEQSRASLLAALQKNGALTK